MIIKLLHFLVPTSGIEPHRQVNCGFAVTYAANQSTIINIIFKSNTYYCNDYNTYNL